MAKKKAGKRPSGPLATVDTSSVAPQSGAKQGPRPKGPRPHGPFTVLSEDPRSLRRTVGRVRRELSGGSTPAGALNGVGQRAFGFGIREFAFHSNAVAFS